MNTIEDKFQLLKKQSFAIKRTIFDDLHMFVNYRCMEFRENEFSSQKDYQVKTLTKFLNDKEWQQQYAKDIESDIALTCNDPYFRELDKTYNKVLSFIKQLL